VYPRLVETTGERCLKTGRAGGFRTRQQFGFEPNAADEMAENRPRFVGVAHVMVLGGDDVNAPGSKQSAVFFY
jgi:hypothetical protein